MSSTNVTDETNNLVQTGNDVIVDIKECSHVNASTLPQTDIRRKDKRIKSVIYK